MRAFRDFAKDASGTTAVFFGLSVLPVFGFVGGAIDYGRAASARTVMQKAVDATALTLVRDGATLKDGELTKRGEDLVRAFLKQTPGLETDTVTVSRNAKTIRVVASGKVRTAFMAIAGFGTIDIGSETEAAWGGRKIELALVLDNTGSMATQNKMSELKKATTDLLVGLRQAAPDESAVKVSIVPFDTHVRVDPKPYRNEDWLAFAHASDKLKWNGYVADRDQPHDAGASAASTKSPASLYPAASRSDSDLARVMPLTSVVSGFKVLDDRVGEMRPKGCTNITIGTSWGLATLSSSGPMPGAAPASANVEKIMVVLTDGDNTKNRWTASAGCDGRDSAKRIDARTEAACQAAKDAGVKLYTVRVIEGNASLLRGCASLNKKGEPLYYDVQNAAQINGVFRSIMDEILATRLTH